jgi:hypothetical protein
VRTAVDMGGELEARCKVRHKGSKSASNQRRGSPVTPVNCTWL